MGVRRWLSGRHHRHQRAALVLYLKESERKVSEFQILNCGDSTSDLVPKSEHTLVAVPPKKVRMGRQSNNNFVITTHKRRGPIAAEFQSPGPAAINLPGLFGNQCLNESTKAASPAFTFAGKHEQKVRSIAPSPNTYNTAGLTARGVTSDSQGQTMGIKHADPKKFLTPAPGAYKPEESELYLEEKIQHSMGIKPSAPKKYLTPAPGAYKPEDSERYLEEKIQHSMGIKPANPKKYLTPAPGAYKPEDSERYLEEKTQHSMGIKTTAPKKYLTPAPGAYKPENTESYLEENIQHSMGMKLNGPKKYLTPAPGLYRPENSERYLEEKILHSMGIK